MNLLVCLLVGVVVLTLFVAICIGWMMLSIWLSEKVTGDPNGWLSVLLIIGPFILLCAAGIGEGICQAWRQVH